MDKKSLVQKAIKMGIKQNDSLLRKLDDNLPNGLIKAEKGLCTCSKLNEEKVIYLGTVPGHPGGEFETLDNFYCVTCNHTWMEP